MSVKAKGLKQLKSNFQKEFRKLAGPVTEKGLRMGLIQGASYATELTPVATSNLVNSQYIDVNSSGGFVYGKVGYTANYAEDVHDAKGSLKGKGIKRYVSPEEGGANFGNYWDGAGGPDSGEPMYLVKAFERNQAQIFKAIALGSSI